MSDALNRFRLDGRIVLVTGASSGLGTHFAHLLASAGARVAMAARRADKLKALVETIEAAGGEARALSLDVTAAGFIDVKASLQTTNIGSPGSRITIARIRKYK